MPIDVGFDLRVTGHEIRLSPGETAARHLDGKGRETVTTGTPAEIAAAMRRAGYVVAEPFAHRDLDGEWSRLLPDGSLEMRDPNDGQGFDPADKRRHQYRVRAGVPESRALPPEAVGDTWRDEPGPPAWEPMGQLPQWDSILTAYLRHEGARG